MRELTSHPPDRVLMVSRDLREYGARGFGVDYDLRAGALLRSQYRVENIWRSPRFEATLFTTKTQGQESLICDLLRLCGETPFKPLGGTSRRDFLSPRNPVPTAS